MSLEDLWRKIQQTFLILKDWYENHELYHKIGYLIASEKRTLQEIFRVSENKTKQEFRAMLDSYIRDSISIVSYLFAHRQFAEIIIAFHLVSWLQID